MSFQIHDVNHLIELWFPTVVFTFSHSSESACTIAFSGCPYGDPHLSSYTPSNRKLKIEKVCAFYCLELGLLSFFLLDLTDPLDIAPILVPEDKNSTVWRWAACLKAIYSISFGTWVVTCKNKWKEKVSLPPQTDLFIWKTLALSHLKMIYIASNIAGDNTILLSLKIQLELKHSFHVAYPLKAV